MIMEDLFQTKWIGQLYVMGEESQDCVCVALRLQAKVPKSRTVAKVCIPLDPRLAHFIILHAKTYGHEEIMNTLNASLKFDNFSTEKYISDDKIRQWKNETGGGLYYGKEDIKDRTWLSISVNSIYRHIVRSFVILLTSKGYDINNYKSIESEVAMKVVESDTAESSYRKMYKMAFDDETRVKFACKRISEYKPVISTKSVKKRKHFIITFSNDFQSITGNSEKGSIIEFRATKRRFSILNFFKNLFS